MCQCSGLKGLVITIEIYIGGYGKYRRSEIVFLSRKNAYLFLDQDLSRRGRAKHIPILELPLSCHCHLLLQWQ